MSRSSCFLISILCVFVCSCASPEKHEETELEQYAGKISKKIFPIWKAEVKHRVANLASRGLKPIALQPPENEILMEVSISKEGEVKGVQPVMKSKYAFLNQAALHSFEKASPLASPPESCLKEDICKIQWKFVVE